MLWTGGLDVDGELIIADESGRCRFLCVCVRVCVFVRVDILMVLRIVVVVFVVVLASTQSVGQQAWKAGAVR